MSLEEEEEEDLFVFHDTIEGPRVYNFTVEIPLLQCDCREFFVVMSQNIRFTCYTRVLLLCRVAEM